MKTTKRTTGALAFLATFVMVLSVMAPLADAGAADNSAPVLFSDSDSESNSVSKILLGTGTNDDGITVCYEKAVLGTETDYMLTVILSQSVVQTLPNNFNLNITSIQPVPVNLSRCINDDGTAEISITLDAALESGNYAVTIPNKTSVILNLLPILVTEGGYDDSSEAAKNAINDLWNGGDIEDVDNKTIYLIYEQIGTFSEDVMGKLYFDDEMIYEEKLVNNPGQHIWYFSFSEGAPAEISKHYKAGTYTLKIVSNEVVLGTAEVTIDELPEQQSLKIINQGYEKTQEDASSQITAAWGKPVTDVISNTMWVMFNQAGKFTTLEGELYFEDETSPVYSEDLTISADASKSGNKLWYFSFDDQANSVTPNPGKYTLKIVGDNGKVIDETTVTIANPDKIFNVTINYDASKGSAYGTKRLYAGDVGVVVTEPQEGKMANVTATNAKCINVSENIWTISNPTDDVTVNVTFEDKPVSDDFRLEIRKIAGEDENEGKFGFNASLISNDGNYLPQGTLKITYTVSFIDNTDGYYTVLISSETVEVYNTGATASLCAFPSSAEDILVSGFAEFTYDVNGANVTVTTETILA